MDELKERFPNELDAIKYFEKIRWGNKRKCAYCDSENLSRRTKDLRFKCYDCNKTSSVTVGTLLHRTNIDLRLWILSFYKISNDLKKISAGTLATELGINFSASWTMYLRLRDLMSIDSGSDGRILVNLFKKTSIRGLKRRLKINKKAINKFVNKSKGLMVLQLNDYQESLRFSEIMKSIAMLEDLRFYFRWIVLVDYIVVDSFWAMVERQIKIQHDQVNLEYLDKYIKEAIFQVTPPKNIDIFEMLVKNSMRSR